MLHELKRKAMQNPEDPEARYALAEALFGEKQFEAAIKQLEKAIELAPDHPGARLMLARAYQREGRLTLAERTLEQQVQRFPNNADARDELAEILVNAGRIDDAIVHLEEAIRVDPENLSRRLLTADLALRRHLFARARAHLEEAARLAPSDPTLAARLEAVLLELGVTAARPSPLDRGPQFLAGRARAALETEPIRRALADGALKQAAALLRRSDIAGAKRALVTASKTEQETPGFAFLRGEILLIAGDRDRAEQAFKRAVEHPPILAAFGRLGELCAAAGRHKDAARWFEAWLKASPKDPDALEGLGDALVAEGRPEEAKTHYENALKTRPEVALAEKITALRHRPASDEGQSLVRIGALGWNATGGVVSLIEAAAVPGKGELIFTGNVGPSGQDAAKVAFSCLKARAESLGIADALARSDLHLHFVDTELAKDGPSAGLALALAGLSALSGKKVRPHLAATGEITLQGAVRPVGGLHEKISAAYLAGMKALLLPRKNLFDARRLPAEVVSRVEVFYVDSLTEAVAIALVPREGA
jgi:ATP-dependent Lon protease